MKNSNITDDYFTPTDLDLTISSILTLISSCLSVVGGLLLILSYVWIPAIRDNVRKMLVCLTIADVIQVAGYMVPSIKYLAHQRNSSNSLYNLSESYNESSVSYNTCKTQSFITTSASISSFIWTTFLVIYFYCCVSYSRGKDISLRTQVFMHVSAWGVPVIIATVAESQGVLGANTESEFKASGIWCWIATTDKNSTLIWGLVAGKGWEIIAYFFTLLLYIYMKRNKYFREIKDENHDKLRREDELFCFTWIILYCLRMWGTIRFIGDVIGHFNTSFKAGFSKPEKYLMYIQSIGDSGQSFCNFVLFCVLDRTVRSHVCGKRCDQEIRDNFEQSVDIQQPNTTKSDQKMSESFEQSVDIQQPNTSTINQSRLQSSLRNENQRETDSLLTNHKPKSYVY